MATTYDVRIWKMDVYKGKRGNTYYVRWRVAGKPWKESFKSRGLAESFRSDLISAAGKGEAFDVESGLPVSMRRLNQDMSWYEFACTFVDMQWPRVAATTRRTHAEALTAVTMALFTTDRGKPDDKLIRSALCRWGFNTAKRDSPDCPEEVRRTLRWVATHTRPVSSLVRPEALRSVLDGLTVKLDGGPRAPSVVSRWRKILNRAAEYAVELRLLERNPVPLLKWRAPRTVQVVDRRVVANPVQARTLLHAVGEQPGGRRLVAFFGCLYFAFLRPEEAVSLNKRNLSLPPAEWDAERGEWEFPKGVDGWGQLHLEMAEPYAGKDWTDTGANRDRRQLKQRAVGETRPVPSPPELTVLLLDHLRLFGTAPDGRLFVGERNRRELPKLTIVRAWQRAREATFTPEVLASPLAGTPYDLRHAGVSTMLNAGVSPTTVAEWAGHSVEVLLRIYAKCLDGTDVLTRQRVQAALGHRSG
ncbi:integrase [Longimycelium tulufanense]|uniref:Integrase n=1 Tax=Longimycelium tulufanense TaxID=907463 RepID=A0A8J3C9K9_9PSEU|nr:integrase [Longimycelium tulufanense]GGM34879.1 integrase [Longimycelium tulufanense]